MSKSPLASVSTIHGVAWLSWLGAVLVLTATSRNGWYLGLTLFWLLLTDGVARRQPVLGRVTPIWSPLRFGLWVIPIAALFNGLTVHVGATIWARLPQTWLLIGGPLTVEALLYGALNGVTLTAIFAAFTVANRMLPLATVISLIPRAYYPVAIVVAIALTFVPATLHQWQQIREAQAVRGHQLRGLRDWLPLWLPLLTGGLERALQLAEAMTARGFASGETIAAGWTRVAMLLGLPLTLVGLLLRTVWGQRNGGLVLLLTGALLIIAAIWAIGRRRPHTRYRPAAWRGQDWLVIGGALLAAAIYLLPLPGRDTLFYSPYPALAVPSFALLYGVATWGLLGPLAVWLGSPQPAVQLTQPPTQPSPQPIEGMQ